MRAHHLIAAVGGIGAAWTVQAGDAPLVVPALVTEMTQARDLADVIGDRVAVWLERPRDVAALSGPVLVSAIAVIPASADLLYEVLADIPRLPSFLPNVQTAEVVARVEDATDVHFLLSFDAPVASIDVDYTVRYVPDPPGSGMRWHRVAGDVAVASGRWRLWPVSADATLIEYTSLSDFADMSFLVRTVVKAQPAIRETVPASTSAVILSQLRAEALRRAGRPETGPRQVSLPVIPQLTRERPLPAVVRDLATRGRLLLVHPPQRVVGGRKPYELVFVTGLQRVALPRATVRSLMTQFERFPEISPEVADARVAPRPGGFTVDYKFRFGFGLLSIPVDARFDYIWAGDWALPFRRVAGFMEHVYGSFEWIEDGDGTIVTYSRANDPGDQGGVLEKMGSFIPNRKVVGGVSLATAFLQHVCAWLEGQGPTPVTVP